MRSFLLGETENALLVDSPDISPADFFQTVAHRFRSIGAEHILIAGIPLPSRDLGKLVLYQQWGPSELSILQLSQIRGNDTLLRRIAVLKNPMEWHLKRMEHAWLRDSAIMNVLLRSSENSRSYQSVIGMHIHHFGHMQIAICLAGEILDVSTNALSEISTALHHEIAAIHAISPLLTNRPGDLSSRERMVLGLTAEGKTAGSIAEDLQISQRTVHAHLQNASEKMLAANKTQTVIEALRYGQIQL